ncbi:caspase family protein [Chryseolinea sp. T2]|uniref:caspase family protein n=1 Tax=Chryseolinea sp. T2 TaxID=3129255 RepID=UPI003077B899
MNRIIPVCLFVLISFELVAQVGASPTKDVYISRAPKSTMKDVSILDASRPTAPANLTISDVTFSDLSGNGNSILDANEDAEIHFTLTNTGKGNAHSLAADVVPINLKDRIELLFDKDLGDLSSGKSIQVTLPIRGITVLESGKAELEIRIGELNGFDADPIRLVFNTQRAKVPEVAIADFTFSSGDGEGIALGHPIVLTVMLQNKGQGEAVDIKAEFKSPENVFPAAESTFHIDKLMPNETRSIPYEFFGNKKYNGSDIPIELSIIDGHGQFEQTHTLRIPVDGSAGQMQTFNINAGTEKLIPIDRMSLRSDVDVDVPWTDRNVQNRFALIIGNEDYRKYQTGLQADQNVMFARNDAVVFKEYVVKTLGVSEKHAFMLTDATRGQMSREIERITELAKLTPNAEIIFYYAGHGLPDLETQESYLVPVDVTASNLSDAIKLRDLYSKLASSKASRIMVFLDACFSGGGRGENGLLAARTVKIRPKSEIVEGNIVAFTATSGKEVSLPFEKQSHGLFTYHLLKKLQETQGNLTLDELGQHLEQEIPKASLLENSILQRPQVLVSPELDEKWMSWKF